MSAPAIPSPMAALVARQREQLAAWLRQQRLGSLRRKVSRSHPAPGSPLAEQRRMFLKLDSDSECHPRGFACPACPPDDTTPEVIA